MLQDFRNFDVTDPFGRTWHAEFRWHQNAISIRHADAVDVKYFLTGPEERREIVLALAHPDLVKLAAERGRELTDAWVMRLAALQLHHMISSWTDMEHTLVQAPFADLARHNSELETAAAAERQRAELTR
jgi:hypothetical protein